MFGRRYFGGRYFGARYFGGGGDQEPEIAATFRDRPPGRARVGLTVANDTARLGLTQAVGAARRLGKENA